MAQASLSTSSRSHLLHRFLGGLLDIGGNRNKSVGSLDNPLVNADGTVDVYFGPKAPEGREANWVPTVPGKGFFLVFRFYGPTEGYIDKTWALNDLELMR